jgi:NAD(P)H-quinone oxidoreductase subunit 5
MLMVAAVGSAVTAAGLWWTTGDLAAMGLRIDGLTITIWVFAAMITAIIGGYSLRYIDPVDGRDRFLARMGGFWVSVSAFAAADHVAVVAVTWLLMCWLMVGFIRHDRAAGVARRSHQYVLRWFLPAAVALLGGLMGIWWWGGVTHLSALPMAIGRSSPLEMSVVAAAVMLTAVIQGGLFPAHRWLVVSMCAPTPASALMHAGFVNAGAVIVIRTAPLLDGTGWALPLLAVIGAVSAIVGGLLHQVTADRKLQLSGSTSAQMGFMLLQLGLGLATAAVVHLILHGWYKAGRFLSIGDLDWLHRDVDSVVAPRPTVIIVAVLAGVGLFVMLTRKLLTGGTAWLLVGFVAVMIARGALAIERRPLPSVQRGGLVIGATLVGIGGYGLLYRAVDPLIAPVAFPLIPPSIDVIHIGIIVGFAGFGLLSHLGVGREVTGLYVWLVDQLQVPADVWGDRA